MAVPTGKSEVSGALIVAAGLILGGLLSYVCDRLNVPTPGLLLRRPSTREVNAALGQADDYGGAPAGVEQAAPDSGRRGAAQSDVGTQGLRGSEATKHAGSPEAAPSKRRGQRLRPIEINGATLEELQQVDGIGPTLAGRIVEFRRENGPFHRMEDLLQVKGIGPATLARIKATASLGDAGEPLQNTLRTSTSSQADSSSFHR